MRYTAVIFDLDGVICSTDHYHHMAWKSIADELGIAFEKETAERLRGVSRMESLNIILASAHRQMSKEDKAYWAGEKNRIYRAQLSKLNADDVLDGVGHTLQGLRQEGLKLAIGSSSRNAQYILERLGIVDSFDAVCDGTQISHSKPDPEVFVKAAALLGISPEDCLVVEDAEAGLHAALNGGMECAAFGPVAVASGLATWNLKAITDLLSIVQ